MSEETGSLKSGDKVRIKKGLFKDQVGEVINTLPVRTRSEISELVWVKFVDGRVEGFNPKNLEKFGEFSNDRAA
jgi:transcription antitermination factor NusG